MKVSRPAVSRKPVDLSLKGISSSLARVLLLAGAAVCVVVVVVFLTQPGLVQSLTKSVEESWGYEFRKVDANLTQKIFIAIGAYLRDARVDVPEVPQLFIDVPFKEMSRIYEKREEALARRILIQGPDDFVKASIRYGDRTIPVKMRLKGDWTDHLTGLKWSFRIHTRDDEQIFGLRRFSIQSPYTRGFQAELLFFELLSKYGVMHPRYMFVDVNLNGEPVGLMALEEFFTKELLEFNRRREGVIVRFDESLVWQAKDSLYGQDVGWGGAFDHYTNANIDAFGSSRIAKSEVLSAQYAIAEGLLRAFVAGTLQPSEVFDVQQMGAFIAVSEFLGAKHSVAWANQRYYLNPISLKLEPIAFDGNLHERFEADESIINEEPMIARILRDPLIWQQYASVLRELGELNDQGEIEQLLRAAEAEPHRILQTEFRLLTTYPLDNLQARAAALLQKVDEHEAQPDKSLRMYHYSEKEEQQYPIFAHLGLVDDPAGAWLKVETAVPKEVGIYNVEWLNAVTGERSRADQRPADLPFFMPPRGIWSEGRQFRFNILPQPGPDWTLEVTTGLRGRTWGRTVPVPRVYMPLQALPVPDSTLDEQLAAHAFLQLEAPNQLAIKQGSWQVKQSLIIPRGFSLHVGPGTTLKLAPQALVVSHGPVQMLGQADSPIVFEPANEQSWSGMMVTDAGAQSVLENVLVKDTTGISKDGWSLTGGVNFYRSDVRLTDCEFRDSQGEDALNIIHSNFEMVNVRIDGTASDAFDADFAVGTVTGGEFLNIGRAGGGDAIDVSGSQVTVTGTGFNGISDKAISVGERSQLSATEVAISNVGTGAASKDGSQLTLIDSTINGASFVGLTAYIKKPEYGPAEIVAENVSIQAAETAVLVQTGSRVTVDGKEMETRDVDVDALYETIMRPGLRK